MVFSDYAPLDHVLPRYLSVALLRRLNRRHIKTIGHSSLRWVGRYSQFVAPTPAPSPPAKLTPRSVLDGDAPSAEYTAGLTGGEGDAEQSDPPPSPSPPPLSSVDSVDGEHAGGSAEKQPRRSASSERVDRRGKLNVLTSHSFDHLDTATHSTDRLVLAGVDVASVSASLTLDGQASPGGGAAKRKRAGTLEVDARRGAVVVNAELAASSRVWVAGDMACFPSQAHGGKRLVLRSVDHAHHSGKLAGENMAAASRVAGTAVKTVGGRGGRRYCHSPAFVGEAPLAGVRLAMVGDCDAALPTHGFWWTNSATGLSRKVTLGTRGGATTAKRQPRASGVTLRTRRTVRKDFTPVFGTGVVFYTSGAEVKGAMLWGFPGEAAAAASIGGSPNKGGRVEAVESPADAAAGLSARALDLLRHIMGRSANMEADLSDERVMAAWLQGLSDAAKVVAQETGLGHLQPTRR